MMKKRIKQGGALILAAVLMLSAFVIPKAFAADGVKVGDECSLTIDVTDEKMKELVSGSVTVDLYRVADIAVTGAYTSTVDGLDFSTISSTTTAADWEALAASAANLVVTNNVAATRTVATTDGKVTVDGLATGLYLVSARTMKSDTNQYDFKPYLISLPNNYWNNTAKADEIPDSAKDDEGKVTDEWIYDFTVSLKPAKSDLYGDLVITKTLDTYNASLGEASFIFKVEAKKVDVDDASVRIVYSNVVSMTFDGTGTQTVQIDDIPAGAEVTITEVYTGASYTTNSNVKETVIIADGLTGAPATVDFLNTYSGELNGGSSMVNNFTYEKNEHGTLEWDVDQIPSPEN